ncbi:MAG: flagellar type III secretion system pore protein FliP [Tissierellaceae bacterium]
MTKRLALISTLLILLIVFIPEFTFAEPENGGLGIIFDEANRGPQATVNTVKLLILLTVLTLAPSFLILTTCFTRIVVVLSFLRNALGTQQSPPNQLLLGLALFLTFFVMQPVYSQIMEEAVTPFLEDEISQEEAIDIAVVPMKRFMLKETREKDLALFLRASGKENVKEPMDLSMTTIIPAFAISELKRAFSIGFIIYIPFLVIDMVVASILMSMGMFMLPPVMISLPFKLLLFVLVDGWYLVVESLLSSFA